MPAADATHRQMPDADLVADVHGLPRATELNRGLRIGIQRGLRVGVDERRQPFDVSMVWMLMGDQDRREAGDALESVREIARIKQDRRVITGIVLKSCE